MASIYYTYSLVHQTYPKRECIPIKINACLYEAMHISLHNHNMDGSISYKVGSIVNELASKRDSTTHVNKHDVLQSDWGIVFQYLRQALVWNATRPFHLGMGLASNLD